MMRPTSYDADIFVESMESVRARLMRRALEARGQLCMLDWLRKQRTADVRERIAERLDVLKRA
jgi:hypothetical protein